ncbi:response regulator transcription factor [Siminovitchia fortis]|uniref:Response regulator transcription factor n=1 Tax=Siminovitchia fortis TaxID=254758 RepID=A0A443IYH5_9BACI|nr:response regulator transcription factor [Siminovitchia fortis]RWR13201.1 response regulator transcription factor [Siminovitchia fortis]WHY82016.1 response regulator transcription factor [Siminovitchia fortis]
MERILVVEDEPSIVTLLQYNLEKAGFSVLTASDGNEGLKKAMEEQPDLMILDLMLPGMDGMDICKTLRQEKVDTPILMLTARGDEFDKVLGLELGADDYLTKPFSPREVVARVKAILRRTKTFEEGSAASDKDPEPVVELGQVTIYPERYEALLDGERLELTPKEFELLLYLASNEGKVLSRTQLLDAIWNYDFVGDSRIVDVHISNLREKIEEDTRRPRYIKTIRGFGYKMERP